MSTAVSHGIRNASLLRLRLVPMVRKTIEDFLADRCPVPPVSSRQICFGNKFNQALDEVKWPASIQTSSRNHHHRQAAQAGDGDVLDCGEHGGLEARATATTWPAEVRS